MIYIESTWNIYDANRPALSGHAIQSIVAGIDLAHLRRMHHGGTAIVNDF